MRVAAENIVGVPGYVVGLWMVALTILLIPSTRVLAAEPGESVFKTALKVLKTERL